MTEKQQKKIEEMRKANAIYANVMVSFKDTPEEVKEVNVKLREYDENDPVDRENDDDVFYYFGGIDELVEAMDAGNNGYEFTILSIVNYEAQTTSYDAHGFEIKRGDEVIVLVNKRYVDGIVVGDPDDFKVGVSVAGKVIYVDPLDVEVDYEQIKVKVTGISWDMEEVTDGNDPHLPHEVDIPLFDLVNDYVVEDFGDLSNVINEYLSDKYEFMTFGYSFDYDRKSEFDEPDEKEALVKEIKEAVEANGKNLYYYIDQASWNGYDWEHESGYFTEKGVVRFDDNPLMTIFESYDEIDLDILQECFDAVVPDESDDDEPEEAGDSKKAHEALMESAGELKKKIFDYVKNQKNQAVFFDTNHAPLIPTNEFEDDFFVEVQGIAIFTDALAVYFDDPDWDEYDFNNDEDVEKILDGDFWRTGVLEDNHPYYLQTLYSIAKFLNL